MDDYDLSRGCFAEDKLAAWPVVRHGVEGAWEHGLVVVTWEQDRTERIVFQVDRFTPRDRPAHERGEV